MDFDKVYGAGYNKSTFFGQTVNHNGTDFVCSDKIKILWSSLVIFNCLLVLVNVIFLILFIFVYKRIVCASRTYEDDFDLESLGSTYSRKGRNNNGYSAHAFNNVFKEPPSPGPPALKRNKLRKSISQEDRREIVPAEKQDPFGNIRFKKCVSFEDAEPSPRRGVNVMEVHDEFLFADEEIMDYTNQQTSHKA